MENRSLRVVLRLLMMRLHGLTTRSSTRTLACVCQHLREFWSSPSVPDLADAGRVFLESIVDMGYGKVPETMTLRNTLILGVGEYGSIKQRAAAGQVRHAADGPAGACC